MKKILAILLTMLMIMSFAACDGAQEEITTTQPEVTEPEETLPELGNEVGKLCYGYELPVVDENGETGETIDPTKTGKVTVINFWGTWCNPCTSEMPHFEELATNYSETVTVIAVHSLEGYKKMPAFLAENYADSSIIFSWETTGTYNKYNGDYCLQLGGGVGYPYTVVLDARGIITEKRDGMMPYEDMVAMVENAGAKAN